jgi:hypothetical protein
MADGDDFMEEAKEISDTFTEELEDSIAIPGLLLTIIVGKLIMLMQNYESTLRKKEN